MLSVADALEIVLRHAKLLSPELAPLSPPTLGLVVAEDVASDLDMPPFDKAMMDGFALRASDLRDGKGELTIIEDIPAGKTPTLEVKQNQASRIMTGAPIPHGADAVVMIERCEVLENNKVRITEPKASPGLNILSQAKEMRTGDVILKAGARLRPQEFGLLAAVGRIAVQVYPSPRVAILATGDELVEPSIRPGRGQIRNSNGPMLVGQVVRAGGVPRFLGIARDEPAHLRSLISEGMQADVLILSGGVSAGKLDLVPGILAEVGVQALFHKVAMKPGKPVLFGIKKSSQDSDRNVLVFGLPGNPVSSLVCFELFVRPALRRMMSLPPGPHWISATLTKDHTYRTDRPTYHPARLTNTDAGWTVEPVAWFGSPDLRSLLSANAFVFLAEGEHTLRAGDRMKVLWVEDAV